MVPFVSQQLNNLDLALAMAKRGNLPGAEGLIVQQFERLFAAGQYKEAAECAAESPQVRVCVVFLGGGGVRGGRGPGPADGLSGGFDREAGKCKVGSSACSCIVAERRIGTVPCTSKHWYNQQAQLPKLYCLC